MDVSDALRETTDDTGTSRGAVAKVLKDVMFLPMAPILEGREEEAAVGQQPGRSNEESEKGDLSKGPVEDRMEHCIEAPKEEDDCQKKDDGQEELVDTGQKDENPTRSTLDTEGGEIENLETETAERGNTELDKGGTETPEGEDTEVETLKRETTETKCTEAENISTKNTEIQETQTENVETETPEIEDVMVGNVETDTLELKDSKFGNMETGTSEAECTEIENATTETTEMRDTNIEKAETETKETKNVEIDSMMTDLEEDWENLALNICQRDLGEAAYRRKMDKESKVHTPSLGSKMRLSYVMSKIKKIVTSAVVGVQHYNAIGAIGYAVVCPDVRFPKDKFFVEGRRFRVRLRHCAIRCDDDAASCVRQAALKFADQNEDGPFDLVMSTGRAALACNCKTFHEVLTARSSEQIRTLCYKNPKYFHALVDALRRRPSCYDRLHYHSHLPYLFTPTDGSSRPCFVKFRLVPAGDRRPEPGKLSVDQQHTPWRTARNPAEKCAYDYLRRNFVKQLEAEPVQYKLQVQLKWTCRKVGSDVGSMEIPLASAFEGKLSESQDLLWNAQNIWDEKDHPWLDLMELIFTTPLPATATNRTAFNLVNRPPCLRVLPARSVWDYRSYHMSCSAMYTTMELKNLNQINMHDLQSGPKVNTVTYIVTLCTGQATHQTLPKVDVFITLTGVSGRTAATRLDRHMSGASEGDELQEHFKITVEEVGEVLAVTIGVRHRQLTADWMLRYVSLLNVSTADVRTFPCHKAVSSKVTLRPGNVCLPNHEIYEVVRQERALEIRDRQQNYTWRQKSGLPSVISGQVVKDLPPEDRLLADKYACLPWDLDLIIREMTLQGSSTNRPSSTTCISPTAGGLPQQSAGYLRRQNSYDDNLIRGSRRASSAHHSRSASTGSMVLKRNSAGRSEVARRKWSKIKFALQFITKASSKIPDGVKGDMCRKCLEDSEFGHLFTQGPNPMVLRQIFKVPVKLNITSDQMDSLMDSEFSFAQELQNGRIFCADYELLEGVPVYCKNGNSRHCAAPIVLLYNNRSGKLVPLAIQLRQNPSEDNPVWTATDSLDDWLLAKLWVRFADSINQFATHIFYCHLVMEPFVVATMRQLSASHPIYKLLKPHFRYMLAGNTLMRTHLLCKDGALDKWTSVGAEGNAVLMKRLYERFSIEDLDFMEDLKKRAVNRNKNLTYYFRDDGIRLWNAVLHYCNSLVEHFYRSHDDVVNDAEIQAWLRDVRENGFPGRADDIGLPRSFESVQQVVELVCKVVFTATCRHAATHTEAMDMYGHDAVVPALMRQPPPKHKGQSNKELLIETLPDQKPELYNSAIAYTMSLKKADQSALGQSNETYFVEKRAKDIHQNFQKQLKFISKAINKRNSDLENPYDTMLPEKIPNSVEPLPFMPDAVPEMEGITKREEYSRRVSRQMPSVPLLTMPICMTFARSIGGKSTLGRRLSVNVFSQAMSGISTNRVNVPMDAIDRNHFDLQRMHYTNNTTPQM